MTNEIKDKVSKVKNSILERIKGHGDSDKKGKGAGNDGAQKDGVPKDTEGDGKNTSDQKATEVNENNTSDQNATGNDGQNTTESGTGGKNGTEDQVNTLPVDQHKTATSKMNDQVDSINKDGGSAPLSVPEEELGKLPVKSTEQIKEETAKLNP